MQYNFFQPDDFQIKNLAPSDTVIIDINAGEGNYRGQTSSLRAGGSSAGRPVPPESFEESSARYKKSRKKRKTRRRVPVVESDIYAVSSDED